MFHCPAGSWPPVRGVLLHSAAATLHGRQVSMDLTQHYQLDTGQRLDEWTWAAKREMQDDCWGNSRWAHPAAPLRLQLSRRPLDLLLQLAHDCPQGCESCLTCWPHLQMGRYSWHMHVHVADTQQQGMHVGQFSGL